MTPKDNQPNKQLLALQAMWSGSSIIAKAAIVIIPLIVIVIIILTSWGVVKHFKDASYQKKAVALETENQRITDEYWEAVGERNALRVQAQQARLEADAYREAGERRGANVAALDEKIGVVRGQYDEIQNSVGDCSSVADCRKQLCAKYKQAGVRLANCPD